MGRSQWVEKKEAKKSGQFDSTAPPSIGHEIQIRPTYRHIFPQSGKPWESKYINSEIRKVQSLDKLLYRVSQNKVYGGHKWFYDPTKHEHLLWHWSKHKIAIFLNLLAPKKKLLNHRKLFFTKMIQNKHENVYFLVI